MSFRGDCVSRSRARRARLCRLLSLFLTGSLFASSVFVRDARAQACTEFDADGNGQLTVADILPLSRTSALVSECLSVDLRRLDACVAHDVDRDGQVAGRDLAIVLDAIAPLYGCLGVSTGARAECAAFDLDRDARVSVADAAAFLTFRESVEACLGVDLSDRRCAGADVNGDGWVSVLDGIELGERQATFATCFEAAQAAVAPPPSARGLWVDRSRVRALPVSGPAWDRLWSEALRPGGRPNLSDPEDRADTQVLARALVAVRLGDPWYRDAALEMLRAFVQEESEQGGDALALARNLVGYVLAADLLQLADIDPELDRSFRARLDRIRDVVLQGRSLRSTHAERPNNWGTHAGASRVAIALYLGDEIDLAAAIRVHRAWLGDAAGSASFRFGSRAWQADPARPVGVNPRRAVRDGIDVDGAQPEEMRRGGPLADPPARTGYAWEALQGATVTTALLARNGYPDAWSWGDDAIERAVDYLYRLEGRFGGWAATGDDRWNVWLVNQGTGRAFPTERGVSVGKNMGFTDWTHAD